jgi:hypothetical protein
MYRMLELETGVEEVDAGMLSENLSEKLCGIFSAV